MATNCLLRLRFEAMFICLSVATSFGATAEPGRIVIPAKSSTQTTSAGLQKLSGRNGLLYIPAAHAEPLPLLILLHKAGGSPSEWLAARIVRALCGQGPFHHSCAGIARPKLGHRAKKIGATTIWRSI